MVSTNTTQNTSTIILSPNRSTEWKDIKRWLLLLSLPALIIAIGWLMVGVWIILPFAGLELGLLSYFMYKVCYQNYRIQKITVKKDTVILEDGIHTATETHQFARPDCYLSVKTPSTPMESLELSLFSEAQSSPVGDFLNPSDRELARRLLVKAGLIECSTRWWKKSNTDQLQ
ncbi:MAG: DUF2244 domain-containing protein [Cellvibrionaceae bacterium]